MVTGRAGSQSHSSRESLVSHRLSHRFPPLADFLPYRLSITSNAVSGHISGEYHARSGLKVSEWRVMAILGDRDSATQRDLVEATLMDKVAVNRACRVLEERGLISRTPNASDGRSHHLELTATGVALYDEIMPLTRMMERRIFETLTQREQDQLMIILKKLMQRVDELNGTPVRAEATPVRTEDRR